MLFQDCVNMSSFLCALMILQSCSALSPLNSDMKTGRSQSLSDLLNGAARNNELFNDDFQKDLENIMHMQNEFDSDKPKETDNPKISVETSDIKSSTPSVAKPTVSSLPPLPNEILDQLIGSMGDHETPPQNSEETHDNLLTITEPTEDAKNGGVLTKTNLKIKISMDRTKNDTTTHHEKQMQNNEIEKNPEFDEEQYLNKVWNTSVPVLIKNNKASIHPKVELNDLSQVIPEISELLKKLKELHRPGHITVVILNPKSLRVNKAVVKKTKICCELRHILINNSDKLHSMDTDSDVLPAISFPPVGEVENEPSPSEEEEIHPDEVDSPWNHNEQMLVSNILNNLHLFAKPQHLSALSFNPNHVIQNKRPITLVHLRIKFLSPVKIRGKVDNNFRHQDIFPEPESAELQHSGSYDNELEPMNNIELHKPKTVSPKLIHMKFKLPLGTLRVQEIPFERLHEIPASQHSGSYENDLQPVDNFEWNRPSNDAAQFPSPKVHHMKLNLHHDESFKIQDIPFDRLHETSFAHAQPEKPFVKDAPMKKPTMVYFIMHNQPKEASPELQSFLKEVFQIPDTRNRAPNHQFIPENLHLSEVPQAVFRHPFEDSFRQLDHLFGGERNHHFENSRRNDFDRMIDTIGNSLEQMEHSTEGIKDNTFMEDHLPAPQMRSFSPFHAEFANPPRRFDPAEDHQKLPFEIFKMFNTEGLNLFPSQGKFSASKRED
ncbi:hypothetical protein WDU94_009994 [Cyamophila willieti]